MDSRQVITSSPTGWIILTIVLTGIIILLLLLWIFSTSVQQQCVFTSPWGVIPDTAGTALMNCGSSNNQICTFPVTSLSGAINQCDQVQCTQFMYNELLQEMTIVDPAGPRVSTPQTDLFIRNGSITPVINTVNPESQVTIVNGTMTNGSKSQGRRHG